MLQEYKTHVTEYQAGLQKLGRFGVLVFALWQELQGQRRASFGGVGEIDVAVMFLVLDAYKIEEHRRQEYYSAIRHTDAIVVSYLEKKRQRNTQDSSGKDGQRKRANT